MQNDISMQNVQSDWSWIQIWKFSMRCTIPAYGTLVSSGPVIKCPNILHLKKCHQNRCIVNE